MALQDLTMMLPSRLGCPLSLKTPNMGNTGLHLSQFCWLPTPYTCQCVVGLRKEHVHLTLTEGSAMAGRWIRRDRVAETG